MTLRSMVGGDDGLVLSLRDHRTVDAGIRDVIKVARLALEPCAQSPLGEYADRGTLEHGLYWPAQPGEPRRGIGGLAIPWTIGEGGLRIVADHELTPCMTLAAGAIVAGGKDLYPLTGRGAPIAIPAAPGVTSPETEGMVGRLTSGRSGVHLGASGVAVAGERPDRQEGLWVEGWQHLLLAQGDPSLSLGDRLAALSGGGADRRRTATLSSHLWAVDTLGGVASGAWLLTGNEDGEDEAGPTTGRTGWGLCRGHGPVHAYASEEQGGPLTCGQPADVHDLGATALGTPTKSLHLSTGTLFLGAGGDAPKEMGGRYPRCQAGMFPIAVYESLDPDVSHRWMDGWRPGLWRRWTTSAIWTPDPSPSPRPTPDPIPREPTGRPRPVPQPEPQPIPREPTGRPRRVPQPEPQPSPGPGPWPLPEPDPVDALPKPDPGEIPWTPEWPLDPEDEEQIDPEGWDDPVVEGPWQHEPQIEPWRPEAWGIPVVEWDRTGRSRPREGLATPFNFAASSLELLPQRVTGERRDWTHDFTGRFQTEFWKAPLGPGMIAVAEEHGGQWKRTRNVPPIRSGREGADGAWWFVPPEVTHHDFRGGYTQPPGSVSAAALYLLRDHCKLGLGRPSGPGLIDGWEIDSDGTTLDFDQITSGGSRTAEAVRFASGYLRTKGYIQTAEIATPATPASGYGDLYFKTDGKPYALNDAGTEYDLAAGAVAETVLGYYVLYWPGASDSGEALYPNSPGTDPLGGHDSNLVGPRGVIRRFAARTAAADATSVLYLATGLNGGALDALEFAGLNLLRTDLDREVAADSQVGLVVGDVDGGWTNPGSTTAVALVETTLENTCAYPFGGDYYTGAAMLFKPAGGFTTAAVAVASSGHGVTRMPVVKTGALKRVAWITETPAAYLSIYDSSGVLLDWDPVVLGAHGSLALDGAIEVTAGDYLEVSSQAICDETLISVFVEPSSGKGFSVVFGGDAGSDGVADWYFSVCRVPDELCASGSATDETTQFPVPIDCTLTALAWSSASGGASEVLEILVDGVQQDTVVLNADHGVDSGLSIAISAGSYVEIRTEDVIGPTTLVLWMEVA